MHGRESNFASIVLFASPAFPGASSAPHLVRGGQLSQTAQFWLPSRVSVCSRLPCEKSLVPKCAGNPRSSPDISNSIFYHDISEFESYMPSHAVIFKQRPRPLRTFLL